MAKIIYKDEVGNTTDIPVQADKSILEMLEEAGIDYPFSCMAGACSACKIKVTKGKEHLDPDKFGSTLVPVEDNESLSCITGILDDKASDEEVVIELEKCSE